MQIQIGNSIIGKNKPTFVVAEMSGNHGGDLMPCEIKMQQLILF